MKKENGAGGDKMKKLFSDKKFKYGLNATILTIAVIGIVILLNILLSRYSFRKDITESKIFQLSEQTRSILASLDKSGKIADVYLFKQEQEYIDTKTRNLIEGLLKQYEKSSNNFRLKTIDIEKNPAVAKKYGVSSAYEVVFEIEGRTKIVALMDTFEGEAFNGEKAYTSAIMTVMNEKPPVVYFIQGHKEANINKDITYLKKEIERGGYVIKTINLAAEEKIPDDASMLIDIGAKTEFIDKEISMLKGYLGAGGKAIFLMSSIYDEPKNAGLNDMFKTYGIQVNNDIVIEPKIFINDPHNILPTFGSNEIVNKMNEQQSYMILPAARSITILPNVKDITVDSLLNSTPDSWGETSIEQDKSQKSKFDPNDKKGPLSVAVYASKGIDQNKKMQLVVLGNELVILDEFIQSTRIGTGLDFVVNSMSALNTAVQTVTIGPKPLDVKTIVLPYNKQVVLFYSLVLGLPGLILLTGLIIWLRRRHL